MPSIIHLSVLLFLIPSSAIASDRDCETKLYRQCHQDTKFTEEEIENVRLYIQKRYAKTNPIRKPCKRLHVRKDIKCLSKEEFQEFVDVIKKLYRSGFMDKMTELHHRIWPAVHKFNVGVVWHRWFVNVFEKEMLRINPRVTLPYWDHSNDFAEPHKSKIWDLFGHSGTAANDYCVSDGPFANMTFKVPTPHCLRRQWNPDGTINPWEGPEWESAFLTSTDYSVLVKGLLTAANLSTPSTFPRLFKVMTNGLKNIGQDSAVFGQFALLSTFAAHFKTHLSIGGFNGDMSRSYAPNDPLFYVFHNYHGIRGFKFSLMDDRNLVPDSYDFGVAYDFNLKKATIADLNKDTLPGFPDVTVREAFQLGYGENCHVYDNLIKPINDLMKGHRGPIHKVVARLKSALPINIFEMYYAKFAHRPNEITLFDYLLPYAPDNCNLLCRPSPVAFNFEDTPEGQRTWKRFKYDYGFDLTFILTKVEESYLRFMNNINHYKYCSPYVL